MKWLAQYTATESVDIIVVGKPTQMDGTPSESFAHVEPLFRRLQKEFPAQQIVWFDERFTSVIAHRAMLEGGLGKMARRDKALVDKVSATLILESFMESRQYKDMKTL
jgi:putative Holliday junction resolvase